MINTISSTPFDSFGNQGFTSGDAPETDLYADLFAALFDVPGIVPPTPVAILKMSQGQAFEEPAANGSTDLSAFLSDTDRIASLPTFMPAISDIPSPDLPSSRTASSDQGPLVSEAVPLSAFLPKIGDFPRPDFSSFNDEQWPALDLPQAKVQSQGSIDLSTLLFEPDSTPIPEFMPKVGDLPSPEFPTVKDERMAAPILPEVTQKKTEEPVALEVVEQTGQEILELSPQMLDTPPPPAIEDPGTLPSFQEAKKIRSDVAPVPIMSPYGSKKVPFSNTPPAATDSAPPRILPIRSTTVTTGSAPVPHFAPVPIAEQKDLPKQFKDVSSVVKADDSLRMSFQDDPLPSVAIVEKIKQSFSSDSSQSFERPQSEVLDRKNGGPDPSTDLSFGATLRTAGKEQKLFTAHLNENKMSEKVFHQIEPRLLELIAVSRNDSEKSVLKMRLTPADLGAVEITVERNAAGRINAHFQTEHQSTREILTDSLVQLRDSLERSGIQVGDLDASCTTFSSNGHEGSGERRQEFGKAENQPGGTTNFDGISQNDDDKQDRLLNLRA